MEQIYVLKTFSNAEEYIRPDGDVHSCRLPAMMSELQFLDRSEIWLGLSDDGGLEIPDVLVYDGILFVSDRLKQAMDEFRVDYVFYKKTNIASQRLGIRETFWMMIPPRLECLDTERSIFDGNWHFEDGLIPRLRADKIVVDVSRLGRYKIFKIAGLLDDNVYLTEELCQYLKGKSLEGVTYFTLSQ